MVAAKRRRSRSLDGSAAEPGVLRNLRRGLKRQARWFTSLRHTVEAVVTLSRCSAAALASKAHSSWRRGAATSTAPPPRPPRRSHGAEGDGAASQAGTDDLGGAEGKPRGAPRRSLSALTIRQLKARIAALGLSVAGCTEREDLVALLRGDVGGARRRSFLRKSLRRASLRRASLPKRPAFAASAARQREELMRIAKAQDGLQVLGLTWRELRRLPGQEREKLVVRRYRDLCRAVHPDKCPPDLRAAATRAFQRLETAKQHGTSPAFLGASTASAAAAAMSAARVA
eukprot:TRINITY_DN3440_c0_g1_i5.p1 TRINITY_DN3440_c0_g1~~TRINITY_DN3440_c0_g1_i5.p1  ORF type:complete len:315 (+),score=65.63 TRINITY_DN3440_c0_g1_i5:88-945(+)